MARKRQPYKTYTQEFKLEALRRMEQSNRPASEIAMQLGIRRNQLYKWKAQMAKTGEVPTAKVGCATCSTFPAAVIMTGLIVQKACAA